MRYHLHYYVRLRHSSHHQSIFIPMVVEALDLLTECIAQILRPHAHQTHLIPYITAYYVPPIALDTSASNQESNRPRNRSPRTQWSTLLPLFAIILTIHAPFSHLQITFNPSLPLQSRIPSLLAGFLRFNRNQAPITTSRACPTFFLWIDCLIHSFINRLAPSTSRRTWV